MSSEDDIFAVMDLIYEAACDGQLWSTALVKLADVMKTAQIGILSLDRVNQTYDSIAPRCDPAMDAVFKDYWAFHNPLWPRTIGRPVHEIFLTESLIPREDLITTPFFNEWMRPAEFGVAAMGTNLLVRNKVSTMITVGNAPGDDEITTEQKRIFKTMLRHIDRAIRIHHRLQLRDLDRATAPDQLEQLQRGVLLVDGTARVLYANAVARSQFSKGGGLALKGGHLQSSSGTDVLQRLIASCQEKANASSGPGGETWILRGSDQPALRVMVAPLRSRGHVPKLPWLGLKIPVAIVIIADAAREKAVH